MRKADFTTVERLKAIGPNLRAHGPGWLIGQFRRLLSQPARLPGRLWRASWVFAYLAVLGTASRLCCLFRRSRRVTLFYDLQVSPVTFDVCWALASAEHLRRERGLKEVALVFVPGPSGGFRDEDAAFERVVDTAAREKRLEAILVATANLLP